MPGTDLGFGYNVAFSPFINSPTSTLKHRDAEGTELLCLPILPPESAERLAILYPTSNWMKGSVRIDDRFETAHPSPRALARGRGGESYRKGAKVAKETAKGAHCCQ